MQQGESMSLLRKRSNQSCPCLWQAVYPETACPHHPDTIVATSLHLWPHPSHPLLHSGAVLLQVQTSHSDWQLQQYTPALLLILLFIFVPPTLTKLSLLLHKSQQFNFQPILCWTNWNVCIYSLCTAETMALFSHGPYLCVSSSLSTTVRSFQGILFVWVWRATQIVCLLLASYYYHALTRNPSQYSQILFHKSLSWGIVCYNDDNTMEVSKKYLNTHSFAELGTHGKCSSLAVCTPQVVSMMRKKRTTRSQTVTSPGPPKVPLALSPSSVPCAWMEVTRNPLPAPCLAAKRDTR